MLIIADGVPEKVTVGTCFGWLVSGTESRLMEVPCGIGADYRVTNRVGAAVNCPPDSTYLTDDAEKVVLCVVRYASPLSATTAATSP